jgi:hypothetical protein
MGRVKRPSVFGEMVGEQLGRVAGVVEDRANQPSPRGPDLRHDAAHGRRP